MSDLFPYIHLVPKDPAKNREFRKDIVRLGMASRSNARDIWRMCARDLLFTVNAFGWTFDPRKPVSALPFVTWKYQDEGFEQLLKALGKHDLLSEKSRDMGLSWMMLTVFWNLFRPSHSSPINIPSGRDCVNHFG